MSYAVSALEDWVLQPDRVYVDMALSTYVLYQA